MTDPTNTDDEPSTPGTRRRAAPTGKGVGGYPQVAGGRRSRQTAKISPRVFSPTPGPQSDALEATLSAAAGRLDGQHAALIALCRLLAGQIDAAGDNAATRLVAAYLSALKDLARVVGRDATARPVGKLAQLRAAHTDRAATS